MKIEKTKEDLVIKIPLWQNSYNAANELIGKVSNTIPCIENKKFGFIQVIDLGYKGSFDYGMFLVDFSESMDVEDFREICKNLDMEIFEYPVCSVCKKTIYGCFTFKNSKPAHEECC
jgi:hypothetical protein